MSGPMFIRLLAFLFATLLLSSTAMAAECHGDVPCPLGDRSYHIRLPDGWDGTSALPVLLHFHGWGRQGSLIVKHQRISGHTRRRGVLLIAPNGLGRSWAFWDEDSRDVPFAEAVIEDVAKRFPIDRSQIFVSGYSYGAAMAWRYACENGDGLRALIAVSGTIDQDTPCPQAPAEVRQVYGFSDNVMPFPYGPEGEITYPVALWRDAFDCGEARQEGGWFIRSFLTFERLVWDNCVRGGQVVLDVHSGGHFIPHGWIGWQLDQLMGREPAYP